MSHRPSVSISRLPRIVAIVLLVPAAMAAQTAAPRTSASSLSGARALEAGTGTASSK